MTRTLTAPKHITRPAMAREVLAYHKQLDISAWKLATGQEVLTAKGQRLYSRDPKGDVFALAKAGIRQIIDGYLCFYNVDLSVKVGS